MWFDDQFEKTFRRLSNRFFTADDVFKGIGDRVQTYGPYYYGYQMTVGPDGKPRINEWGNVRPTSAIADSSVREPFVDEILNEKERKLKLTTEMPGIEKTDIRVNVVDSAVSISAEHGDRRYSATVPLKYKVDENSAKAVYKNGILEVELTLAEEKLKGKMVSVE